MSKPLPSALHFEPLLLHFNGRSLFLGLQHAISASVARLTTNSLHGELPTFGEGRELKDVRKPKLQLTVHPLTAYQVRKIPV